eukprot:GHUV01030987.1.p1 GENE.GHUV01030987.1~~GHUV01030987.1.p1  ORF type:complete len:137 (-),score=17.66 GHUV01030987.1:637-1047(-)
MLIALSCLLTFFLQGRGSIADNLRCWCCCCLQELYGDEVAGAMLNALSRLLTFFLQGHGFTCGMDDLLLKPQAEGARTRVRVVRYRTSARVMAAFIWSEQLGHQYKPYNVCIGRRVQAPDAERLQATPAQSAGASC